MSRRPLSASARHSRSLLRRLTLAMLLGAASAAPALAADARASRYYEDALTRFEKKDHAGAIIQLKNALQIDRNQLAVQVLLGRALLADSQPAAAEVALQEALRLGVNRAEVAVPLAQAYIGQGKHAVLFEQVALKADGLPPGVRFQILLLRASASADMADTRSALATIAEARALDPRSADTWLAEVPVRIRTREFPLAAEAADKALALLPNSGDAWYHKGSVAHVRGDLRDALASYERAIAAQPDHVEARVTRAGLLLDLQRPADAAKELAELQRLSPREPRAAYLRALTAERDGKPDLAKRGLQEVTALLDPVPVEYVRYRPQLLLLNGLAHFGLDEREKAKPYLESFQRAYGQGAASKLLAQIYLSEKNPARAAEVLDTYLKGQPTDQQAVAMLATAQMAQGNSAKATSLMQEALRANDAPEFRSMLGLSLLGGGHAADARPELEAAFKRDPSQIQAGIALVGLYTQSREFPRALAVASALVKQRPADPSLLNLLGIAKVQAGDAFGARAAFEQALKLDGSLINAKLNLARLDMAANQLEAAAARLAELLKANERHIDSMLEMAVLSSRLGQPEDALGWLQRAADLSGPREIKPGLALVDFQLRRGQNAPALEAAKRLTSKAPEDPSVLLTFARTQLVNGDATGARSTLSTAARIVGFDAFAQVQVALLQVRAGNVSGAAYSLDKALSAQPDYLPALALMTDLDIRQGAFPNADRRVRQIVQSHPKRAIGYSLQGDLAMAQGQRPAAVEAFRRAHQAEPSSESVQRLFTALLPQDGGKAAIQLGEQWVKSHPQNLTMRKALADAHARAGRFPLARSAYESLLKTVPNDAAVLNNLANVLLRLNDPSALQVAERALVADPGNAAVLDTVGWAAFQAKQIDRALQLLRDARLRDPDSPEIRYHLAVVLAKTGRAAEARQELDTALRGGRSFEALAEAEALARTLK